MKQIFIITITLFTILSCKAQQPIIALYNGSDYLETNNAYYKDIDGDLIKLVGTWQYTNGNELFKITIKKKEQKYMNIDVRNIVYFKDVLYGEYQYINTNGTEVLNTLNNIDAYTNVSEHLIYGSYIMDKLHFPVCEDCSENERRVSVFIKDLERSYFTYDMEIRHIVGDQFGNPEQIKIIVKRTDMAFVPDGQPSNDRLPTYQELILNKI